MFTLGNIVVISPNFYPINPGLCAISVIEKRQQSVNMPRNFHKSFSLNGKTRKNSVAFVYLLEVGTYAVIASISNGKYTKSRTTQREIRDEISKSTLLAQSAGFGIAIIP